jgi:ParB family chromosome partitioning protein
MTDTDVIPVHAPCAVIDPEFEALIRPLSADEKDLLEASLQRDGCRDPLIAWKQGGILLDGHNRLDICTRLGIPFSTRAVELKNRDAAKLWVIDNQLGRRNLSDIDRIALAMRREPLIQAAAAKKRNRRSSVQQNSAERPGPLETRVEAATAAGVSHDTYTKGKALLERGVPELVQAVREGTASIHAAAAIATLDPDAQSEAVRTGTVKQQAADIRNHRTRNAGNDEWHTPSKFLEAARSVLGDIDVDPASNAIAQKAVRAAVYYTKNHTGLDKEWVGRVWLNPPYSTKLITTFVDKLLAERACGNTTAALLLVNNETEVGWFQKALANATAICFPNKRIRFLQPNGKPREHGPLQGQTFFYFGPDTALFAKVFGEFGAVLMGNVAAKEAAE